MTVHFDARFLPENRDDDGLLLAELLGVGAVHDGPVVLARHARDVLAAPDTMPVSLTEARRRRAVAAVTLSARRAQASRRPGPRRAACS